MAARGEKRTRNAVNVEAHCALFTSRPIFHGAKPHRVLAGAETIFICRRDSEKRSKCLYKVQSPPLRYPPHGPRPTSFPIPARTWLVTAPRRYFEMDRIVDFGIEYIAEGSVLSSRFIPRCSLRRNSSRYTLDRLAAI